ncbi:MAG: hypothetical protein AAFZ18_38145 [Myxococcota bacterium]
MKDAEYLLVDEPRPGALERIVVRPMWPLLGSMLGITLLGWGWFLLNGIGMGSPTRRAEFGWVVAGVLGGYLILFGALAGLGAAGASGIETQSVFPYMMVALLVWKLFVSYRLQLLQRRVYEVYLYYSGDERSGMVAVIAFYLSSGPLRRLIPGEAILWLIPLL